MAATHIIGLSGGRGADLVYEQVAERRHKMTAQCNSISLKAYLANTTSALLLSSFVKVLIDERRKSRSIRQCLPALNADIQFSIDLVRGPDSRF